MKTKPKHNRPAAKAGAKVNRRQSAAALISSLRGKYKHLGLMEALMEDKKREREL